MLFFLPCCGFVDFFLLLWFFLFVCFFAAIVAATLLEYNCALKSLDYLTEKATVKMHLWNAQFKGLGDTKFKQPAACSGGFLHSFFALSHFSSEFYTHLEYVACVLQVTLEQHSIFFDL